MPFHPHRAAAVLALLLTACPTSKKDDTDTATPDDTGDTDYAPGCITVDGAGGYAYLSDAIQVASEGSTIEVCEGEYEEAVVVDKAVTIVGAGIGSTIWSAPVNEPAFRFTAPAAAGLSGMTIHSTRSAIEVADGGQATMETLELSDVDNFGVDAAEGAIATVRDVTFLQTAWGGVQAKGANVTVESCTFDAVSGFAVKGTDGALLTVTNSTITDLSYTEIVDNSVSDGFALWVEDGASLVSSGNTITDSMGTTVIGLYGYQAGGMDSTGDTIHGTLYGIQVLYTPSSYTGLTLQDPLFTGIIWISDAASDTLDISAMELSGDPAVVVDVPFAELEADTRYLGMGGYIVGSDVRIADSTITGFNDGGLLVASDSGTGTAEFSNVSFVDNLRWGLIVSYTQATATNLNLTNTLDPGDFDYSTEGYVADYPAALAMSSGSLIIDGGSVSGSGGWGIASVVASAEISGVTFSGNTFAGMLDFQGTSTLRGNTFTQTAAGNNFASLYAYQSNGMVVDGNTFADNITPVYEYSYTWNDGEADHVSTQISYNVGFDVQAYSTASFEYLNNVSSNGSMGVYLSSTEGHIHDNTWTGYTASAISASGSGTETATIEDNTVTGSAGSAVYLSSASAEVERLTVTDGTTTTVTYEYYTDGVLDYSGTYTTYSQAVTAYYGRLAVSDSTFENLPDSAIYTYGSSMELDGIQIKATGTEGSSSGAIYAYWYGYSSDSPAEVEAYLNDVVIDSPVSGAGVYVYAYGDYTSFAAFELDNVEVISPSSNGLTLYYLGGGTLTDVSVTGGASYGAYLYESDVTMSDFTISDNASTGVYANWARVTLDRGTITRNQGMGIDAEYGALVLTDSVVSENASTGVYVVTGALVATGNTIEDNGAWGMSCSSVTVGACENTVTGNAAGENSGCDERCVLATDPGDTGDTGIPADTGL